jgi:hypothetical protein
MTSAVDMTLEWPSPGSLRARQLALATAKWLVAVNIVTGAPLFALWAGAQFQTSGAPSMGSVVVVVVALAATSYGLIALFRALAEGQERLDNSERADGTRLPWLHGKPRVQQSKVRKARAATSAAARSLAAQPPREPLILIDGDTGGSRPWRSVTPHLEFGFEVLAGVLPRDGSIDGTTRAMDRVGWQTAHVVARPCDARAAVDLARLGRARSLLILENDAVAGDSAALATEIAELAAFRPPS